MRKGAFPVEDPIGAVLLLLFFLLDPFDAMAASAGNDNFFAFAIVNTISSASHSSLVNNSAVLVARISVNLSAFAIGNNDIRI